MLHLNESACCRTSALTILRIAAARGSEPEKRMNQLATERFYHSNPYLTCPKFKGRPKKHVAVCRKCKWKAHCRAYQTYWQPELPFRFRSG